VLVVAVGCPASLCLLVVALRVFECVCLSMGGVDGVG